MLLHQWKWMLWAPIVIGAGLLFLNRPAGAAAQAGADGVTDFAPLPASAEAGWLVLDGALYRTVSGGAAWERLGPETPAAAAFVLDDAHAWLVLAEGEGARLARTADGGQRWTTTALPLDLRGRPAEALSLRFLDAHTGWLTVRWAARRNFSLGALFATRDGGETWTVLPLPLGEPVRFATAEAGWLAGGPAGDDLFQTNDGGRTWQAAAPPAPGEGRREALAPLFPAGPAAGFLPVLERGGDGDRLAWHATTDGGLGWQLEERVALPAGVQRLAWATRQAGWALAAEGWCDDAACLTTTRLWRTSDGGRTWAPTPVPGGGLALQARAAPATLTLNAPPQALNLAPANTRVQTATGQGFDSCTMPTLDEMQAWIVHSPYRVWNLYLGGSSRANCGTLTAGYLAALAVQGWRFIPTWVGPQAACSGFLSRMSYDPPLAYQQGVAEANLAVDRAAALGLTFGDRTGTVLYYDLEAYDIYNSACRAAASAFISGWTGQVRARGNVAGVYGASCTSALSDFAGIANVPDVIWAAYWLLPAQYRSNASVFGLPCLDDSLWNGGQRLRQYSGGHNETWGAATLNIDSNVLAGVVADLRDPRGQTSVALELYQGADYAAGPCAVNLPGWFNLSGCGAGWEDQVSSLKVGVGWSVRLYRDADLGGPSACVVLSDPSLDNDALSNGAAADNQASSAKIYTNTSCWDYQMYVPLAWK